MDFSSGNNSLDGTLISGMSALAAIVNAGNFSRASELLCISPSAVTRSISRLESKLGVRLLNRTTRSVSLTNDGRQFYERIAPLMTEMQEAANAVSSAGGTQRGRLRLNVDPFFSRLILAPRLSEFVAKYPAIELEIVTRDYMGNLVADGFDLAVRFGEPAVSSFVARKLLKTRIVTVASQAYIDRHGLPQNPGDLAGGRHQCIHYRNPETGRPFPWEFHRGEEVLKIDTRSTITLNDVGTMHTLAIAGLGIAQVMMLGCEAMLDDGRLIDIFPGWSDEEFPLHAIYPSRQLVPTHMRLFLDFVAGLSA